VFEGVYPDGTPERHTVADKSSSTILKRIGLAFPGLSIVNEEDVASGGGWRPTVSRRVRGDDDGVGLLHRAPTLPVSELSIFIDPLDGTQEYTEGLWKYVTVSACVARCGVPLVGIIYQPFSQRLYWTRPGTGVNVAFSADAAIDAERALPHSWESEEKEGKLSQHAQCCRADRRPKAGEGAIGNWSKVSLTTPIHPDLLPPGGPNIVISRSHTAEGLLEGLHEFVTSQGYPPFSVNPVGGAGYKLIQVLEGTADAYIHPGSIRKWDICAGEALLRAAGGGLLQWDGKKVDYCLPPLPGEPHGYGGKIGGDGGHEGAGGRRQRIVEGAVRVPGLLAGSSAGLVEALREFSQWWSEKNHKVSVAPHLGSAEA